MNASAATVPGRFSVEEIPAPTDLLELLAEPQQRGPLFFWSDRGARRQMLGLGVAAEIVSQGDGRLTEASERALALLALAVAATSGAKDAPLPRVVGGFGFDSDGPTDPRWRDFPACRFVLPAQLWILESSRCWVIRAEHLLAGPDPVRFSGAYEPESSNGGREAWMARVHQALDHISCGELEKVVLSRSHTIQSPATPDIAAVVSALCRQRPGCFTYWVRGTDTDFFGSSPELLAHTRGRTFATESVAGTIARGLTVEEDRERAASLLASDKNRREQAAVSAAIAHVLGPYTTDLQMDPEVHVFAVPEAHHLATTFQGRLDRDLSVLDLAGLLHPTPAVCGSPAQAALDFIRQRDAERGWFTGGIGWMDACGSGDIAVALRSALVDDRVVTTTAGAGIVAGSEPGAEYEETELKMRALEDVLENGQ